MVRDIFAAARLIADVAVRALARLPSATVAPCRASAATQQSALCFRQTHYSPPLGDLPYFVAVPHLVVGVVVVMFECYGWRFLAPHPEQLLAYGCSRQIALRVAGLYALSVQY